MQDLTTLFTVLCKGFEHILGEQMETLYLS
jgi:hypothetical protein